MTVKSTNHISTEKVVIKQLNTRSLTDAEH